MNLLNIDIEKLKEESRGSIEERIRKWDKEEWRKDMETKSTLEIYRRNKRDIREVDWFRNGRKYSVMIKARSNTLRLNWRERQVENKVCLLCRKEAETLKHFLMDCEVLQGMRNECVWLQLPRIEKEDEVMERMLLFSESAASDTMKMLNIVDRMYSSRNKIVTYFKRRLGKIVYC